MPMAAALRNQPLDFLQYLLVRTAAETVNALPRNFVVWMAHRFGDFFYFAMPKRKKIVLENLDLAFKNSLPPAQKKQIARDTFRSVAASFIEFFRIPAVCKEASNYFRIEGAEHLDEALKKGKGIIFVVSHLGSWEYLSFLFYLRDYPGSVIVREIKNPYIYEWLQRLRARTRIRPIDRIHSAKKILRALKQNEMLAILIDQWAGHGGLWVDFFGKKTSTTSIPARLALKTGAALIPGYCVRTPGGQYQIVIKPEVPVEAHEPDSEMRTTLRLNQLLEEEIRRYPGQWTWTHRRWKSYERHIKT